MAAVLSRIEEKIEVPKNVELTIEGNTIRAKGENGETARTFAYPGIRIRKEDSQVIMEVEQPNKRQMAVVGTIASHIRNMIKGVSEGFVYKLKIFYSHFPMTVKVQGSEVLVENFLGEKTPRKTRLVGKSRLTVKGTEIEVHGHDLEEVAQTAANLEQLTRVKKRDSRVFQDGIYLVERDGVRV